MYEGPLPSGHALVKFERTVRYYVCSQGWTLNTHRQRERERERGSLEIKKKTKNKDDIHYNNRERGKTLRLDTFTDKRGRVKILLLHWTSFGFLLDYSAEPANVNQVLVHLPSTGKIIERFTFTPSPCCITYKKWFRHVGGAAAAAAWMVGVGVKIVVFNLPLLLRLFGETG